MSHPMHSFRRVVALLSDQFGNLNLGINQNAKSLNEMLPLDGVHRQVVHNMLQGIYQRNKCNSLDANVSIEHTFDALGELAWQLKSAKHAELDALTLLEQIGECLSAFWAPNQQGGDHAMAFTSAPSDAITTHNSRENLKPKPSSPLPFRLPS